MTDSATTQHSVSEEAATAATRARERAALVRRYFDACNAADHDALMACLAPDAVHYVPPGPADTPWRGAEAICRQRIGCVERLGSQWTIETMLFSPDSPEAVVEWTHWQSGPGTAQRGDEWYVFDETTGLIREIRSYHAAPAVHDAPIGELVGFDYAGRGYHLKADADR